MIQGGPVVNAASVVPPSLPADVVINWPWEAASREAFRKASRTGSIRLLSGGLPGRPIDIEMTSTEGCDDAHAIARATLKSRHRSPQPGLVVEHDSQARLT